MYKQIEKFISGKKIILLGESAHGVREFNTLRVDLIRWLHEEHKFNVVMIEGIVGPLVDTDCFNAHQILKNYFHSVYHTQEVLELIQYIQNSSTSSRGGSSYSGRIFPAPKTPRCGNSAASLMAVSR